MYKLCLAICGTLALSLGVSGQGCGIEGIEGNRIELPALSETTPGGTVFARFQLWNVVSSATISHPFNKYIVALRYVNGVYDLQTDTNFPDFVSTERSTLIERAARFTCEDGTFNQYTFVIPVPDENNNAPTFSKDSYTVIIQLPLFPEDNYIASTDIVVTDLDLNAENADIHVTSSNRFFTPVLTKLPGDIHKYQVDLHIDENIQEGIYATILTADDGKFPTTTVASVVVLSSGTPETEGTEPPTTPSTSTLSPPTTEEASEETPEVEPSGPTTVRTTTTTEEPESCGLVDIEPGTTITLPRNLDSELPTGSEVWRHTLFNVVSTSAVSHPHNKYLNGFRQGINYWFSTTAAYEGFIDAEGTNVMQRTVNFFCESGTSVRYQFEFRIQDGPEVEPTLSPLLKALV